MSLVKRTHQSGCSWEISFSYREPDDTSGRFRRRFTLESERAARELADRLVTAARRDGTPGIRRELEEVLGTRRTIAPTLAQFAERFLDEYCRARNRPAVIEQRRIHLRVHWIPYLGELPLDRITEEHLIRYRRDKLAGLDGQRLAASTLQSHFRTLSKLYHCARDWGVIGRDAGPAIRLPRQARLPEIGDQWLRPDEEQRLVEFLLGLPVTDPRRYWTAPVLLALRTGLRQGEIRALRHRDLYYYGDTLMVRVCRSAGNRSHLFFATKDEDERVVPVSACARWELERLGFGRPRDSSRGESAEDLLWPGSRGPELAQCKNRMNRAFRELLAAAGITRRLTWHGLRHTFGTRLAHKYGDLRVVQSLLGHSSLKTTEIYLHVAPTAAMEAVNCLDDYADARQGAIIPWRGDDRQTKGGPSPAINSPR